MNKPTSEYLASVIVSNRVLGLNLNKSKECMSELLRRREEENDLFDFESYIDNQIQIIKDNNDKSIDNNKFVNLISSIGRMI